MRYAAFSIMALALTGTLSAQGRRPMTTDDGINLVGIRNATMTPDGRYVFYGKSELDWDKNKRKTTYYMISADGGEAFRYIGEAGGSAFQFSPDGAYLSFKRKVEEKDQIFVMRTAGGEAVQLTEHKVGIGSYQWAEDASQIFFVATVPRSEEDEKSFKAGFDAIVVDEGPNGQQRGNWNNLWVFDLASKEERQLTDGELIIGSFSVAPDAQRIAYTARTENRRNQANLSEIFVLKVADGSITQLTENNAPERGLQWSPDGGLVAYTAADDKEWELRQAKIWVIDPDTKAHRLATGDFDGRIARYWWGADGRTILFNAQQRTNANVFRVNVESGRIEQLTKRTGSLQASGFSKDRTRMVYSFSDFDTPMDIHASAVDGTDAVQLTTANPWVRDSLVLAKAQVIRWKSQDGLEVEGILSLPPNHQDGERLPLVLHVHGGPAGFFSNSFRPQQHVWAGLGYVQLMPNVRGSSGYTDDLLRGNLRDIGGGDYWDLMTGVDHVIAAGYVDPEQMGIRGWSYGGILGGWTITQTDRFKGASLGAMVSDWASEYGPGFNFDVRRWYIGGTPWENPEGYRQRSALTHAANVTTPTIILHGIDDRTDTEHQSMMFFTALKDQGKTVRYIKFPREPHGFREPRHQRARDIEEIGWIQKYVRGLDWTPWERKEEKKEEKEPKPVT